MVSPLVEGCLGRQTELSLAIYYGVERSPGYVFRDGLS